MKKFFSKANPRGFTLLELMIACSILLVAVVGILSTYITCLELVETTKNSNLAFNAAQHTMEQIRSSPDLTGMINNYHMKSYAVSGMPQNSSVLYVYMDNSVSNILNVSIGVCWKQKSSRIIGECQMAGGSLTFVDGNGNHVLDSPVELSCLMAQR